MSGAYTLYLSSPAIYLKNVYNIVELDERHVKLPILLVLDNAIYRVALVIELAGQDFFLLPWCYATK